MATSTQTTAIPLGSLPPGFLQAELDAAISLHHRGLLGEAEKAYRAILAGGGAPFEAAAMLGTLYMERRDLEAAVSQFKRAIQIQPDVPLAHAHLGVALSELGRHEAALASYQRAIALKPDFAEAINSRGLALHELGRLGEALASFDLAISLKADSAEALNNRGRSLIGLGRYKEALESCNQAVRLQPDNAEAFNNRGLALHELKRYAEAIDDYHRVLALRPGHADALNNTGLSLHELGRFEEAIKTFEEAIACNPNGATPFNNRGNSLQALKRFDEAIASLDRAIDLDPYYAIAYCNRGNIFKELKRYSEAMESYQCANNLAPNDSDTITNRAQLYLLTGQFAQGWEDYEQRWYVKGLRSLRSSSLREADVQFLRLGAKRSDLRNKRVLLLAEQGVGDEIMFASMTPDLAQDAATVALECDSRLARLFGRSFPAVRIFPSKSPPIWAPADFDCLLPSGSLGRLYRNSIEKFPRRESYLAPDPKLVRQWKDRLCGLGEGLKIGISWKGGTEKTLRERRSVPLELWRPILDIEGAHFVSLQYGDVAGEADQINRVLGRPVTRFERSEIDDFDDLAALVTALDLVISVQTALVHLSGAIGQRCWVMVPYSAEWRYGAEGRTMPWYSSVKLLRQQVPGDWQSIVQQVATDLLTVRDGRGNPSSPPVPQPGVGTNQRTVTVAPLSLPARRAAEIQAEFEKAVDAHRRGDLPQAETAYRSVLMRSPKHFEAAYYRGVVLLRLGKFDSAELQLRRAIGINDQIASVHYNRGVALQELQRFEDALTSFEEAIALQPNYPQAFINRGAVLQKIGRFEEVLPSYDAAIALNPNLAEAFHNRGLHLHELQRLDEGLASFERAIALRQHYPEAYSHRANTLVALGRFEEAVSSYDRALASQPDYADALYGRALAKLMLGRFREGWEDAEHRWASDIFRADCRADVDPTQLALRLDRGDVRNKRVLVVAEQGIGDEIMFASMIPDLVREGGGVALECDRRLSGLFGRSFPGTTIIPRGSISHERPAGFDHLLPAGSLGRLYRNSLAEFPSRRSYLTPDAAIVARWRSRLAGLGPGLKVGISWKGGTKRTRQQARSIPLELWRPILELAGVRFVSLQYGDVKAEIDEANEGLSRPIAQFAREEIDDFDQLAGLVGALDLVISVQTSLVHLSGALGQACWVMVPHVAEWRYGAEGNSMPWYSSVRLYRQTMRSEWGETLARVAGDLIALAAAPAAKETEPVSVSVETRYREALAAYEARRLDESEGICQEILTRQRDHFDAAHLLGIIQLQSGRMELAEQQLRSAVQIRPQQAIGHNSLGIALKELGRMEEALACFETASRIEPRYVEALINRGAALHALGRFEEAVATYDQAIALRQSFAAAYSNRGNALKELKRLDEALASHDRAVALDPTSASALNSRAHTLHHLKAFEQALESCDRAVALSPGYAEAFYNRGLILHELRRFEEALTSYDRAIALDPDYPNAYFDRALARLILGRFNQGWDDSEHRWRLPSFATRSDIDPRKLKLWIRKESLSGSRLLVISEQGIGDEIMFASMISDLARDARAVTLECDSRLVALFARSFHNIEFVRRASLSPSQIAQFDHLLPAGSLGRLYRRSLEDFPVRSSYLRPDQAIVTGWRQRLSQLGSGMKIGISWRGGTDSTRREARSIPLELFRPLLELEGARFVSLQYGDVTAEVDRLNRSLSNPIALFQAETDDFDQLAGLVGALDLVISVQTAVVHLSGAIGKRTWVMVPQVAEWRYGAEGNSMPWYSSVRLYRQKAQGEWGETLAQVASDLVSDIRAPALGEAWRS